MSEDQVLASHGTGHTGMAYEEHEKTFALFISLLKNGLIVVFVVLALLAYFTL